jgi:hypothetical protein
MDESDGRQGLPLLETPGAEMKKYYWPLILQGFVLGTVLAVVKHKLYNHGLNETPTLDEILAALTEARLK